MTTLQIEEIKKISGFDNNFRPPQPLNGRDVYAGSYTEWHYPYQASAWGKIASLCEHGMSQSPIELSMHKG